MKIAILIATMFILAGCAGYQKLVANLNTPPAGCEDSLVYKFIPQPSITMLLSSIPYEHLINNDGYLKWARSINTLAVDLLKNDTTTYRGFAVAILAESTMANQWWGSTLVSVADILSNFITTGGDKPITACDRSWLTTWANNALKSHGQYSFFERSPNQDNDIESRNRICGSTILRLATAL